MGGLHRAMRSYIRSAVRIEAVAGGLSVAREKQRAAHQKFPAQGLEEVCSNAA